MRLTLRRPPRQGGALFSALALLDQMGPGLKRKAGVAFLYLCLANVVEGLAVASLLPALGLLAAGPGATATLRPFRQALHWDLPVNLPITALLGLVVGLACLRGVLVRQKEVSGLDFSFSLAAQLRSELFRATSGANWRHLSSLRMGDLQNAILTEVVRAQVVAGQALTLMNSLLMLAIYSLLSLILSPALTLAAALAGAVIVIALAPLRARAHRFGMAIGEQNQTQNRVLTDFLGALKSAKCLNAEQAFEADFQAVVDHTRTIFLDYGKVRSATSAAIQTAGVAVLAVLAFVAKTMLHMPFVLFSGFVIVMVRLTPRVSTVQTSMQEVISNLPAFSTLLDLRASLLAAAEPAATAARAPAPTSAIALDHVSLAYGASPVLHEVSLRLPVGAITALVGRSGAGKSTTADILAGLLSPTRGEMLLDGRSLTDGERRAWRSRVAYVSQDGLLLNRSIAANLSLGLPEPPGEGAMWRALRIASAEEFARRLPEGLETTVGERGVRLSGGERQRILLARALLGHPSLIILDEAASAVDWRNQLTIARAVRRLRGTTTVLVIAHSMPLVAIADQVIEMAAGRIVSAGDVEAVAAHPQSVLNILNSDRLLAAS